jgi:hypothetical protein
MFTYVKQDFAFDFFLLFLLFCSHIKSFFIAHTYELDVCFYFSCGWVLFLVVKLKTKKKKREKARITRKSTQFFYWHLCAHYLLSFFFSPFYSLMPIVNRRCLVVSEFFCLGEGKKTLPMNL